MENWFVISLKPGQGRIAEGCLGQQGYRTFFPRVDGRDLFTGYGFVQFSLDDDAWQAINGTRGVRHLLPLGHEDPLPVAGGFIDMVREMLLSKPLPADAIAPSYRVGDSLRIVSGPLVGYTGSYVTRRNRGWVCVSVNIFGHKTQVLVRPHQLALVAEMAQCGS